MPHQAKFNKETYFKMLDEKLQAPASIPGQSAAGGPSLPPQDEHEAFKRYLNRRRNGRAKLGFEVGS